MKKVIIFCFFFISISMFGQTYKPDYIFIRDSYREDTANDPKGFSRIVFYTLDTKNVNDETIMCILWKIQESESNKTICYRFDIIKNGIREFICIPMHNSPEVVKGMFKTELEKKSYDLKMYINMIYQGTKFD